MSHHVVDPMVLRELMAQERMSHRAKNRAALVDSQEKKAKPGDNKSRVTEEQIKTVFTMFDASGNGVVTVDELELMFRSLGVVRDDNNVHRTLHEAGLPEKEALTLDDFRTLVHKNAVAQNSPEEAKRVFGLIAGATGPTDGITFDSLKRAMQDADARISDEELREVIRYCGALSGDKESVSLKDWQEVMGFVTDVGQ